MQQNELPSEVILEVPSGSEFDQSRPDLPPVAIYQLEPVIMPLNKNVLVDDEVVLIAVAQNGRALGYASEALRKRRDIVHVATSNSRYALQVI